MNEFLLINSNNVVDLISVGGIIQLGLAVASVILAYIFACAVNRKVTRSVVRLGVFWFGMLDKTIRPLIFSIITVMVGGVLMFFYNSTSILLYSLAIIGIIILFLKSTVYTLDYALKNNKYRKHIKMLVKLALVMVIIFWTTNLDVVLADQLGKVVLHFGKSQLSLWDFIREMIVIVFAIGVMIIATLVLDGWIKNLRDIDGNLKQLLLRISKILVVVIGVFMVLPSLGFDLTALSVLGGAVGVGIGFGLQKIASNFLSGFIILLDKSIKIGDRIIINNITGTVTRITTRYVVMQGFDGSEMLIPNEKFITDPVINQTYSNSNIGIELVISVGYSSDMVLVIDTLRECIASVPEINQNMEPSVYIQKLNESGIDVFVRVWPIDGLNHGSIVRNKLNIAIIESFRKKNIEIPFPKRDVTILK